jgi:hypothetical protein
MAVGAAIFMSDVLVLLSCFACSSCSFVVDIIAQKNKQIDTPTVLE